MSFSTGLEKGAKIYAALLNSESDYWNKYEIKTRNYIRTLILLGISQIRPLLIAVLSEFNKREVEKTLPLVISWSVRFLIHGGLGSGSLESNYCESAVEIRSGNIKTANELYKSLSEIIPNDSIFRMAFNNASVSAPASKSVLARYYLRILESYIQGQDYYALEYDNPSKISLEHIMPATFVNNWNSLDKEEHKAFAKRLGNLALLKTKINSDAKSSPFKDKKEIYNKSEFKTTSMLGQYTNWEIDDIEKRQTYLADLAIKAWPLK